QFSVIYKVILTFKVILKAYENLSEQYGSVDFNKADALKDHLVINKYYKKLDNLLVYYAVTILHLYYKLYCDNSWRKHPE
ncbi:hypothetical protein K469DRAFT_552699, partial [Zopfia rhizophila CBS 207.26]